MFCSHSPMQAAEPAHLSRAHAALCFLLHGPDVLGFSVRDTSAEMCRNFTRLRHCKHAEWRHARHKGQGAPQVPKPEGCMPAATGRSTQRECSPCLSAALQSGACARMTGGAGEVRQFLSTLSPRRRHACTRQRMRAKWMANGAGTRSAGAHATPVAHARNKGSLQAMHSLEQLELGIAANYLPAAKAVLGNAIAQLLLLLRRPERQTGQQDVTLTSGPARQREVPARSTSCACILARAA